MSNLNRILGAGLFLLAAHIEPYRVDGQVSTKGPWEPYPQEFVRNMAIQASLERESVQRSMQSEKLILDQLQQKRTSTTGSAAQTLRVEIKNSSNKFDQLQEELMAVIKKGKQLKDLIGQPDKWVIKRLRKMDFSHFTPSSKNTEPKKLEPATPFAGNPLPVEMQKSTKLAEPQAQDPSMLESKATSKGIPVQISRDLPYNGNIGAPTTAQDDCLFQSAPAGNKDKPGLALRPEVLLKYTPEVLRKYMGGRAYITGQAFIGTEPGLTYLQLYLEFATEQALQQYGNLGKSILLIHLINGKEIRLVVNRFDQGTADPEQKKSTMAGVYYLDKSNERLLADSPVDRIRLVFATGYEEFVIYNVDFFTRQLACINAQR